MAAKDDTLKKLEKSKRKLEKLAEQLDGLDEALDKEGLDDRLIGPRNDIEYRKMLKDIKESGNEE